MAATVDKSPEVAKHEGRGVGNLLRTARTELQYRAMKHVSEGGTTSNNLISSHPAVYLWVEGAKEVSTIIRGIFNHKEK